MAGSYYSSNDVKWSNIRAAERREQAEWDAHAPERARVLSLRQQWCRDEAVKREKIEKEVADEISRQEMLSEVRVNFNKAQELSPVDSGVEQALENLAVDLIDEFESELVTGYNLIYLVFSNGFVPAFSLICWQTITILSYCLDPPAVIGITSIVAANLYLTHKKRHPVGLSTGVPRS
jgi:hypothetical protein